MSQGKFGWEKYVQERNVIIGTDKAKHGASVMTI